MMYSPLAVHCTSLCCDIIQRSNFMELSHKEIDWFYDEIYGLVEHRIELWPDKYLREHEFIKSVALGVLKALHICRETPKARNATWLLSAMESRISSTIKQVC